MDIITTHLNADFDCLGAMIAAKKLYPDALMVFSGSQEKSMRDFFLKSAGYDFPFVRIKDIDFSRITRLIMVDCRHSSRIGRFAELLGKPGVEVHIYDHHPETSGDIVPDGGMIRDCGSSSTILTLLLMGKGISVTPAEATVMMLGIYEDTGSLTFPSTTPDDFRAAEWLLRQGGALATVAEFVTQALTAEQVALLNELLGSLATITVNGVDVAIAKASVDYYIGDIAVLAHMIRDMENLECLFIAVDMGRRVFLVGRSGIPEVDAGEVLRELGGGGHATAASAAVKDLSLVQTIAQLENILRRRVNPQRLVRDIMSSPVKTLPSGTTLSEARELLTKYNVNAMPVMKGETMTGIISRRIVEKALYHGLGKLPVDEYMHTEFQKGTPDTPISEIQDYIVLHNRRFVPVFDGGELVGAVTRTDVLRYLYSGIRSRDRFVYDLGREELPPRRRDLGHLMNKVLKKDVVRMLRSLGESGDELDLAVYAVGGFVRDLLLDQANYDIDITVEGDGILFAETFATKHDCRVKSHRKFGTAVIVFPDGFKIDVASTRLEYYETPGALPTVERSSLKMDLYRRDFTINTLAIRLNGASRGMLVDYFGALKDLRERTIRVLHNLSFVEDPTRVFRAIRFEQRLKFRIAPHTENLIRNAVKMNFLEKLGGKRLLAELVHIFRESDALKSVERMAGLGLLPFIHSSLTYSEKIQRLLEESRRIIDWFELLFLERPFEKWVVYFLSLTDELDNDSFWEVCTRLAVAEHYKEKLVDTRKEGRGTLSKLERRVGRGEKIANSEIYFRLRDLPAEVLLYLMARTPLPEVKRQVSLFFTHLQNVRLHVGGDDLKRIGVPPGPCFRILLDRALAARLDGEAETREDEIRIIAAELEECCKKATKERQ